MMKVELNNEQLILEAAEAEFLEKGFNNAKTTAIAKRAGVTHAMLHYYFRTKENLFQMVFEKKVIIVADSFEMRFKESSTFEGIIRNFIEFHFEFIKENPKLVNFVYNEIISNKANRQVLFEKLSPKVSTIFSKMDALLKAEIEKGTITPIKTFDLFMNIASINIMTFMISPIMAEVLGEQGKNNVTNFLKKRRESNVQFILNALRK